MSLIKEIKLKVNSESGVEESVIPLGDKMPYFASQLCSAVQTLSGIRSSGTVFGDVYFYVETVDDLVQFRVEDKTTGKDFIVAKTDHSVMRCDFLSAPHDTLGAYSAAYVEAYQSMIKSSLGFVNYIDGLGYNPEKFCIHMNKKRCECIELYL